MRVVFAEKVFKGQRSKVKVIARPNALCGGGFYTSRRFGVDSTLTYFMLQTRMNLFAPRPTWKCRRLWLMAARNHWLTAARSRRRTYCRCQRRCSALRNAPPAAHQSCAKSNGDFIQSRFESQDDSIHRAIVIFKVAQLFITKFITAVRCMSAGHSVLSPSFVDTHALIAETVERNVPTKVYQRFDRRPNS